MVLFCGSRDDLLFWVLDERRAKAGVRAQVGWIDRRVRSRYARRMECLFDVEASEKGGAGPGSCGLSVGDAQSRSDLRLHLQTVDRLQRARRIERWGTGLVALESKGARGRVARALV